MNKKIYSAPTMEIVKIETQQVIATSQPGLTGTYEGGEVLSPEMPMFDVTNPMGVIQF
jgi:hypothetical protein